MISVSDASTSGASARPSRREKREAERAAEREAFLTGQQPLLTRREMRRLREEAAALREAVERGELTEEQAKALQNPLADQPVIEAPVEALGYHGGHDAEAAAADEGADDSAQDGVGDKSDDGADESPARETAGEAKPQTAGEESVAQDDGTEPGADNQAPEHGEPESDEQSGPAEDATDEHDETSEAAGEAVTDADAAPDSATEGATGDDKLGQDEPATGDEAADVPVTDEETMPEADDAVGFRPTWNPLFVADGGEAEATPSSEDPEETTEPSGEESVADQPSDEGGSGAEETSDPTAEQAARSLEETAVSVAPVVEDESGASEASEPAPSGVVPPIPTRRSLRRRVQQDEAAEPAKEEEATPSAPVRRPIVRIPATAQGVRTVDSTGELSEVRPVDETFNGIENPHWRALRPESVEAATGGAVGEETPTSTTPDAPGSPAAADSAPGAGQELGELDAADAVAPAAEVAEHEEERSGGLLRTLLMLLLVVVLGLVIGALVWFLVLNRSSSESLGALSAAVPAAAALLT